MISSILMSMQFALLVEATQQLWGEKLIISFTMKIFLICLLIVWIKTPLNVFLWEIMSWSVVSTLCLFCLEIHSFRHAITQKVLSHPTQNLVFALVVSN